MCISSEDFQYLRGKIAHVLKRVWADSLVGEKGSELYKV